MPAGPASADVDLVLAAEFPTVDRKQWSAALAGALDRTGTLEPQEAMARLRSRTWVFRYSERDARTSAPAPCSTTPRPDGTWFADLLSSSWCKGAPDLDSGTLVYRAGWCCGQYSDPRTAPARQGLPALVVPRH